MQLFDALVLLLRPSASSSDTAGDFAAAWVRQFMHGSKSFLANSCRLLSDAEGEGSRSTTLGCRPGDGVRSLVVLAEGNSSGAPGTSFDHLTWLASSLDVYTWLLRRRYVSADELFHAPGDDAVDRWRWASRETSAPTRCGCDCTSN